MYNHDGSIVLTMLSEISFKRWKNPPEGNISNIFETDTGGKQEFLALPPGYVNMAWEESS